VDIHPDALSTEALRDRAWHAIQPHYLARLAGLVEMFGVARSKELGADDLAQIAASAIAGRVGTLLIEADRHIPGRIDAETGRIEFDDLADPKVDDVLDDVGELVLKNRGQIVIVPAERMPTQTRIAAIYQF
jgi:Bacterial archaeo-eukaryotic release factor family 3